MALNWEGQPTGSGELGLRPPSKKFHHRGNAKFQWEKNTPEKYSNVKSEADAS